MVIESDVFVNIIDNADNLYMFFGSQRPEKPVKRPEPVFIQLVEVTEISSSLESSIRAEEREHMYSNLCSGVFLMKMDNGELSSPEIPFWSEFHSIIGQEKSLYKE